MMEVKDFQKWLKEYFLWSTERPRPLGIWLISLEDWIQARYSSMPTCSVCGQVTEQADGGFSGWANGDLVWYCSAKCLDFRIALRNEYETSLADMNRTT